MAYYFSENVLATGNLSSDQENEIEEHLSTKNITITLNLNFK